MAGEERRMLFDIRGRRKNVVRVVYAILALLMGGSLFLTVGPFNISELLGTGGSGSAGEVYDEEVERIEARLVKSPKDEALLLRLTRAEIAAGSAKTGTSLEGETPQLPADARDDYAAALAAWNRYLKQADEPSPTAAQLVASTFFTLSERGSYSLEEVETNGGAALRAQQIAAAERPNLSSLGTLALYEYFYGDLKAGDEARKEALAAAPSKEVAKNLEKQLVEFRKQGQQYQKSLAQFKAQQQQAEGQGQGQGEPFQNPFSLGGAPGSVGQ
jgi:hypothetical protein